jgi:hypothetical protein
MGIENASVVNDDCDPARLAGINSNSDDHRRKCATNRDKSSGAAGPSGGEVDADLPWRLALEDAVRC